MTRSQRKAAWATALTIVSAVCAALLPSVEQLPEAYRVVGVGVSLVGAVAGAVTTALNQSLSSAHVSVPVEKARAKGLLSGHGPDNLNRSEW